MNELIVDCNHKALRALGPWLATVLEPLDDMTAMALATRAELAVHELATNSVDHSNSDTPLVFRAELVDGALQVEMTDDGDFVDVAEIPEPNLEEPHVRGYGVMIIRQLANSLDYERRNGHNIWTAVFDIPTPADASAEP